MAIAIWIILIALALVLLLVLAVLSFPVRLRLAARSAPEFQLTAGVRLLGGILPTIPVSAGKRQRHGKVNISRRTGSGRKRPGGEGRQSAGKTARLIVSTPRLIVDCLRPIHIEHLRVDATLGLDDPADTGQLFGLVLAGQHMLPASEAIDVRIQPDFAGSGAAGTLEASLRFIPLAFIPPGVRFAWRVFGARQ